MFHSFPIGHKKGGMEDQVDVPSRGDVEAEGSFQDDFFDLKWTSSLHLEFLGSSHMKIGHFQPYIFPNFPGNELGCNLLLHFLLRYLVSSLSIVMSRGEIRESLLHIREEGLAEWGVCMGFIAHYEREWGFQGY